MPKKKTVKESNMEKFVEELKKDVGEPASRDKVETSTAPVSKQADPPEEKPPIVLSKPAPTTKKVIGLVAKDRLVIGNTEVVVVPGLVQTLPIGLANNLINQGLVREV